VLLYANTVQQKQLIEENEHSFLHFLNTLLIIDGLSPLPMRNSVPEEEISG